MESFSEDTLYNITSYLTSHDIVNLALTCKHFGGKPAGVSADVSSKKRKVKTNTANVESSSERQWSLMEEMAKRRVDDTMKGVDWQEKWRGTDVYKQLTTRESKDSWIRVDKCIRQMSSKLVFHRLFGSGGAGVGYMGKNPSCIGMKFGEVLPNEIHTGEVDMTNSIAVCQDIMTEGRHYAEFTILQEGYVAPGIMHPIKNCHDALLVKGIPLQEGEGWPDVLQTYEKCCEWQKWNVGSGNRLYPTNRLHQFHDAPRGIRLQSKGTVIGLLLEC